ncbi:unnamed protein product [Dracunculus medinensis]|uniref:BTB domain-containing protein n=1 Tax=Dracunculus medinensis TaxID=318479 RepID=A0A158Q4I4_DRAME|nr:unnamed protein product [Dracunculus medinensis]
MLSILSDQILDNIRANFILFQSAIIFGSSGNEAIFLTKDKELFAIGANNSSCLGTNQSQATLEPMKIEALSGKEIISFAFGSGPHVLALTRTGEIKSESRYMKYFKKNYCNLFSGIGSTIVGTTPLLVGESLSGEKIVNIACGNHHSVAVSDKGDIFTWGRNSHGQLGIGNNINQEIPSKVGGQLVNRFVKAASCGQNNTMVLTGAGEVFSWGFNGNGQLGIGNLSNQSSPSLVVGLNNVFISQIASGFAHSLALSDEGQLFAWGSNSCGQLCAKLPHSNQTTPVVIASGLGRIVEIAAIHPCNIAVAVNQNGKVYMWGQIRGQTVLTPIQTYFHSVDDVFACFANPPVTCRPLRFDKEHQSSILDAIKMAFDDPSTSDLQISIDGHIIHAHKALLRMRCDYFRSRFQEHWKDESDSCIHHMTAITQTEAFAHMEDAIIKQFIIEVARNGAFRT